MQASGSEVQVCAEMLGARGRGAVAAPLLEWQVMAKGRRREGLGGRRGLTGPAWFFIALHSGHRLKLIAGPKGHKCHLSIR